MKNSSSGKKDNPASSAGKKDQSKSGESEPPKPKRRGRTIAKTTKLLRAALRLWELKQGHK